MNKNDLTLLGLPVVIGKDERGDIVLFSCESENPPYRWWAWDECPGITLSEIIENLRDSGYCPFSESEPPHHWEMTLPVFEQLKEQEKMLNKSGDRTSEATSQTLSGSPLENALVVVNGDRQSDYGSPEENMQTIANLWGELLNISVTSEQVCLMMIALKLARESHKHKEDNLIDMAGYVEILHRCIQSKEDE